jgi:hypothetical protein
VGMINVLKTDVDVDCFAATGRESARCEAHGCSIVVENLR